MTAPLPDVFGRNIVAAVENLSTAQLRAMQVTLAVMVADGPPDVPEDWRTQDTLQGDHQRLVQVFAEIAAAAGWIERARAREAREWDKDVNDGRIAESGWGDPETFGR